MEVSVMGGKGYTEKDAAKDTNSGSKEVSRTWHEARKVAQESNHPVDKKLTEKWGRVPDKDRKK